MLTRVLTALVLAPAAIAGILLLPQFWFAALFLGILLMGLYEWNALSVNNMLVFWLSSALLASCAWLLLASDSGRRWICLIGALFWLSRIVVMAMARSGHNSAGLVNYLWGGFAVLAAWSGATLLRGAESGPVLVLAMVMVVWAADSCAYFVGKAIGRTPLAPAISPNKTLEGVAGGLSGALLLAAVFALVMEFSPNAWVIWLVAAFAAAAISVVGDLYQSTLKRRAGVKDSGTLLPGHGGVLDRIDGLLAAIPVFVVIWSTGW